MKGSTKVSRPVFFGLFFLSISLLNACSNPIDYSSDFRVNTDFAAYKTYAWRAPNEHTATTNNYIASEIVDERIRTNIDNQLAAKGFTKVDATTVDFLVNYSITAEDKIDIKTYNTYSGYGPGWGGGYYGRMGSPYGYYGMSYGMGTMGVGTETRVSEYQQGTFVLDVIDSKEDSLVWRGTAEGKMSNGTYTPQERDARISTIVGEVLAGFPPQ